ncbi:hypothetical protein DM45_725 [Burkholderia mallei]|nr:hypothetical protein DM46_46 [Burkholderia mallei]KOS86866.1 hypothetical protein DM45_725 [Burkholderia mallei]
MKPTDRTTRENFFSLKRVKRISRNGLPAIGAIGLGTSETTVRKRVPNPPAKMIASLISLLPENGVLDQPANDMSENQVPLLDLRGVGRRDFEQQVAQLAHFSAAIAGEADARHPLCLGFAKSRQYVRGLSGSRITDQHVALVAERLNLTGKQFLVAVIVSDRRENGRVRRQRHCRQPGPIESKPADELPCDMLRISRASAVTGEQHLAALSDGRNAGIGNFLNRRKQPFVCQHRGHYPLGLGDAVRDVRQFAILHACVPFFVKWQLLTCPSYSPSVLIRSMRFSVGTKNSMKPPPPAPETFPACAPARIAAS